MTLYNINGQQLHVHEEGSPTGKVALLIHGWGSSWYAVSPLLPLLRQRYRCLAVDLPGYGASPRGPERATMAGYADLLTTLIGEVTTQPVVLVGHSMGGMISLMIALKRPELVERMVLLCPTISGHLSLLINLTLFPFVVLERFPLTNVIVGVFEPLVGITDRLLRAPLFADRTDISNEDYERIKADTRRRDQGRIRAECFRAMRENDLRGKLGPIDIPSLVIWGLEDNTVPLRDASVVAREWPQADLRVIPNAGHWPQFETPEITGRYVRAFLSTPLKLLKVEF
ncbi:MAG: alpha/beta hydrolase [Chloroflexota bacterium]